MRIFEGFQKGVNLGGWISQFAVFDEKHFNTFITENDIRTIAKLGFDHVRVPIDYTVLEDEEGNLRESGFNHLSDCRRWCETCGLNMLIDLHECYGYSFDPLKSGMDRKRFFYDESLYRYENASAPFVSSHLCNEYAMAASRMLQHTRYDAAPIRYPISRYSPAMAARTPQLPKRITATAPLCLIGASSLVQFRSGIRMPTNILHTAANTT